MAQWKPDPTFYPSPEMAMNSPPEGHAYVATLRVDGMPDSLSTIDLTPDSPTYGQLIHSLTLPNIRDELHHFGWNNCSAALCPTAPHPHLERRYLVVPGMRSSRIYIIDTKADPRAPRIAKTIEPEEIRSRSGYSRPHTIHCGPEGIYVSALGSIRDGDGPGGIFLMDHDDFHIIGPWEKDRGPQFMAYDFWWHLTQDVAVTSEWGTPKLYENGVSLEDLANRRFGHHVHFFDLRRRSHLQAIDLGEDYQMVLELRPAHNPWKLYGFFNVVLNMQDLSSSIWTWYREDDRWAVRKIIDIPAEKPSDPDRLPPALKDIGMVPAFITDIVLSMDDRFLYAASWGTGKLHQFDVSDPFNPRLTGTVKIGGIAADHPHPKAGVVTGGPQMVEASRDGRRIYFTNSLYSSWDDQFYPGLRGWMVKVDVDQDGTMTLDPDFFVDFGEARAHQVRLEGGDSSSDSFCY